MYFHLLLLPFSFIFVVADIIKVSIGAILSTVFFFLFFLAFFFGNIKMLLIFNISLATNHRPGLIQSVLEIFLKEFFQ